MVWAWKMCAWLEKKNTYSWRSWAFWLSKVSKINDISLRWSWVPRESDVIWIQKMDRIMNPIEQGPWVLRPMVFILLSLSYKKYSMQQISWVDIGPWWPLHYRFPSCSVEIMVATAHFKDSLRYIILSRYSSWAWVSDNCVTLSYFECSLYYSHKKP